MHGNTLAACTYPSLFYVVSDRHSNHHIEGGQFISANRTRYVMPMVMADGHAKPVRIYSFRDSLGLYKPYHWSYPNCHPRHDPLTTAEYGG